MKDDVPLLSSETSKLLLKKVGSHIGALSDIITKLSSNYVAGKVWSFHGVEVLKEVVQILLSPQIKKSYKRLKVVLKQREIKSGISTCQL